MRQKLELGEDPLLEECDGQVLSPRDDTLEGKEKLKRREKYQRAGRLAESWKLARERRRFLEENADAWQKEAEKRQQG